MGSGGDGSGIGGGWGSGRWHGDSGGTPGEPDHRVNVQVGFDQRRELCDSADRPTYCLVWHAQPQVALLDRDPVGLGQATDEDHIGKPGVGGEGVGDPERVGLTAHPVADHPGHPELRVKELVP